MSNDSGWPKCKSCGETEYGEDFIPDCRAEICKVDLDKLRAEVEQLKKTAKNLEVIEDQYIELRNSVQQTYDACVSEDIPAGAKMVADIINPILGKHSKSR